MSSSDEYSSDSGPDVNAPLKRVYLKDIKGRWLHSNRAIGIVHVKPEDGVAILNDGSEWELEEKGGTIHMDEYKVVPELSTLSELVWVYSSDSGKLKKVRWFFEDDGDEELELAPLGKREVVPASGSDDEGQGSDDDSEEDPAVEFDGAGETEEVEYEDPALAVPKLMNMFTEWILSTNTPAHERLVKRQGFLKKEFRVKVRGGGIKGLLRRMSEYGITHEQINHRATGTLIVLKEAARNTWIKKNPEYESHFKPLVPETTTVTEGADGENVEDESSPKRRKIKDEEPSSVSDVEAVRDRLSKAENEKEVHQLLLEAERLTISADLLRQTKVGLVLNNVVREKNHPQVVRDKARDILEEWRMIFRAQKEK